MSERIEECAVRQVFCDIQGYTFVNKQVTDTLHVTAPSRQTKRAKNRQFSCSTRNSDFVVQIRQQHDSYSRIFRFETCCYS